MVKIKKLLVIIAISIIIIANISCLVEPSIARYYIEVKNLSIYADDVIYKIDNSTEYLIVKDYFVYISERDIWLKMEEPLVFKLNEIKNIIDTRAEISNDRD